MAMWLLKKIKSQSGAGSDIGARPALRRATSGSTSGGDWWESERVSSADEREFATHNLKDRPRAAGRRYRRFRKIGKGSYGIVFEACDVAAARDARARADSPPSGRSFSPGLEMSDAGAAQAASVFVESPLVAVKYIEDVFYSPSEAKKVLRELSLMRQLAHPNIVKMFASLAPPDERRFRNLWIVLEHGGITLKQWVRSPQNRPLPLRDVRSVCRQMMQGLEHMHGRHVVHRDIKPSNILIKPGRCAWTDVVSAKTRRGAHDADSPWRRGAQLHVTIIDFGLARTIESEVDDRSVLSFACAYSSFLFSSILFFCVLNSSSTTATRTLSRRMGGGAGASRGRSGTSGAAHGTATRRASSPARAPRALSRVLRSSDSSRSTS